MTSKCDIAVETHGLTKAFGTNRAVDGVDLAIPTGSIYALLGPNGAGKTTLIRMLATLVRPDAGQARVLGYELAGQAHAIRARISLTGQFASVDEDLTGRENLTLLALLYGHRRRRATARADQLLDAFGLVDAADRPVSKYSGGMRRRLDLAASIVVTPELIFLDEPTTGLDPHSRNQLWGIVRALRAVGCTVVLTTQYLDEADQLAERVAVIDHGKIIAEGTTTELKTRFGSGVLRVQVTLPEHRAAAERLLSSALGAPARPEPGQTALSARIACPERVPAALAELIAAGIELTDFALGQPSLDEVFLALTTTPTTTAEPAR